MLKSSFEDYTIIAGCDEAGRGCLAGPVVAAAVIISSDIYIEGLNDSKQLSAKKRELLRPVILTKSLDSAISSVDNNKIDEINILNASILAMHKALDILKTKPEIILVDGNKFKEYKNIKHQCIVRGDAIYQCIAAASILAKTTRDNYMLELSKEYPEYMWEKNKGYPTKEHITAIKKYGLSKYHRRSFQIDTQTKLF